MLTTPKDLINFYFTAIKTKNFESLETIFDSNCQISGPLGETDNLANFIEALQLITAFIDNIVIQHMWSDGDDVITWAVIHSSQTPPLTIVNWSHVTDNKISEMRVLFDTSLLPKLQSEVRF